MVEPSAVSDYQESILGKLKELTQLLSNNFGIQTFAYRKFLSDGRSFGISTNQEWNKWHNTYLFQQRNVLTYEKEVQQTLKSEEDKYFLLRIGKPDPADELCSSLHAHDIWNTLCVYKRNTDGIEGFYFATTKENEEFHNIALNKLSKFEIQCDYFKEFFLTANDLKIINAISIPTISKESFIQASFTDKNKLLSTSQFEKNYELSTSYMSYLEKKTSTLINQQVINNKMSLSNFAHLKFYNTSLGNESLDRKNILQNGKTFVSLSKRELECLQLLSQGKTSKEIGRILNLSHRTIESYIENLKNKVGAYNRSSLIDFYLNNKDFISMPQSNPLCIQLPLTSKK